MSVFDISGRVVVVTGGAGLLGRRYTMALSAAGANVVVADIDRQGAERVAAEVEGAPALAAPVDVADPDAVAQLRDFVLAEFGRVDGLVNNAAIDPKFDVTELSKLEVTFENFPLEAWNRSLGVDLTGSFLCAQAFAPALLASGHGSVINVSSTYGVVGPDQRLYEDGTDGPRRFKPVSYSVTKSALLGFTRYLAAYYARQPLRVNALTLAGVENNQDQGFVVRYSARTMIGRMARQDEYVGALIFLLSDASSYMTGANLVIDGGWSAW